ncbi:hypothetical protein SAY87_011073 [Trapa incisa]|uniref:FYVE-type domain-containing protein n=1 Tax=Trapa incisa TaxID=236973 RepID=A0AAN7GFK0_9MYRT|nr:hypothetical protein SAY87_011073 [Trapa incisa]
MGNGHVPIEGERGVGGSSLFSQLKEMGGRSRPSDAPKINEQPSEKKKGFADWMNLMKPNNEVKDHWHHCRNCGDVFCDKCTRGRIALTADENAQPVRVCDRCLAEVTQRLSNAKEAANKLACLQSHEDLAQKLREEMEKNHRSVSSSKSDGSERRIREVQILHCTSGHLYSVFSQILSCGDFRWSPFSLDEYHRHHLFSSSYDPE